MLCQRDGLNERIFLAVVNKPTTQVIVSNAISSRMILREDESKTMKKILKVSLKHFIVAKYTEMIKQFKNK